MAFTLPNYEVTGTLGMGGMGVVYLGKHNTLNRQVAIKVLLENLTHNPQIRKRFVQEAELMDTLQHSNIVRLYDFTTDPRLCLIMEYVDGRGLDRMIGEEVGPIPYEKALPLFVQILEGIGYAHSKGIIHRDIKPSNILVSKDGIVKITDLGIAKIAGQKGMTKTGTKIGTLYYMSPEQVQGEEADLRSDIYALGMTLYEMLAGRLPFDVASTDYMIENSIVNRDTQFDPREYYSHIPEWLVDIVQKATSKNAGDRFQTCLEFLQTIQEHGSEFGSESGFWTAKVASTPRQETQAVHSPISQGATSSPGSTEQCPKCGEPTEKTMEFCGKCGTTLIKDCPSCKKSIRWHHEFCPKCGIDIKKKQIELKRMKEEAEKIRKEAEKRAHRNSWAKKYAWRVMIPILLLFFVLCGPSGPFNYVLKRFTVEDSIIIDNKTDLQWRVGPDENTTHYEAEDWVDNLGGDWRMPTRSELQGLYDAGIRYDDWGYFENSSYYVWSGEVRDSSSAWGFYFDGGNENWHYRGYSDLIRAFAVRSRGEEPPEDRETVSEPTPVYSAEVRFSQSGSVITDNETNLQWRVGHDTSTNHHEAEDWVDNLGGDWRMPTRSELQGLYDAGIRYDDWGYFENSSYYVWSGEVRDSSSAWGFYFDGGNENWHYRGYSDLIRAFAVRSRGEEPPEDRETVSEPTPVYSAEVRFSQSGSVITDNETNLQWRVGHDTSTNHHEAEDWVDNLGGDWRMPTRSELQGLYDAGIGYYDWGYFENSGTWVWSGEVRNSSSAWGFNFNGGNEYWYYRGNSCNGTGVCGSFPIG